MAFIFLLVLITLANSDVTLFGPYIDDDILPGGQVSGNWVRTNDVLSSFDNYQFLRIDAGGYLYTSQSTLTYKDIKFHFKANGDKNSQQPDGLNSNEYCKIMYTTAKTPPININDWIQLIAYSENDLDNINKNERTLSLPISVSNSEYFKIGIKNTGTITQGDTHDWCYFSGFKLTGVLITNDPTQSPTIIPTLIPTKYSLIPTIYTKIPTKITKIPSVYPTIYPTINPTNIPSIIPSVIPTKYPTNSINPTIIPSILPTNIPTYYPTNNPTIIDTTILIETTNINVTGIVTQSNNVGKKGLILNMNLFYVALIAISVILCILLILIIVIIVVRSKQMKNKIENNKNNSMPYSFDKNREPVGSVSTFDNRYPSTNTLTMINTDSGEQPVIQMANNVSKSEEMIITQGGELNDEDNIYLAEMQINQNIKNEIKKNKSNSNKSLFDNPIFSNAISNDSNIHTQIFNNVSKSEEVATTQGGELNDEDNIYLAEMQVNESIKNQIKKEKLNSNKSLFDNGIFAHAVRQNDNIHNEIVSEIEINKGNFNIDKEFEQTNGGDTPQTPQTPGFAIV